MVLNKFKNIFLRLEEIFKDRKLYLLAIFIVLLLTFLLFLIIKTSQNSHLSKGAISINTNKSYYTLNETVFIGLASIDKDGKTKCDTNFEILIKGPERFKKNFSTNDSDIVPSTTCYETNTNNSDYIVSFIPQINGTYILTLTNKDTKLITKKKIVVEEYLEFNVERRGATRIEKNDSKKRYYTSIKVTSKNEFKGQLVDTFPSSISVVWQGNARIENNKITWDIDLKAGETKEFIYEYVSKEDGPKIVNFGKIILQRNGEVVYEDPMIWNVLINKIQTTEVSLLNILNDFCLCKIGEYLNKFINSV